MRAKGTRTTRRDFLTGKSVVEAAGDLGSSLKPPESAVERGAPASHAESRSYLIQVGRRAMACQFDVLLNAEPHSGTTEQAIAALDLIDTLEDQLSVYRHRSEVSRLNALAAHRAVNVEERLFGLLQQSVELYHETNGAFDITSGPLIQLWRTARREGQLPTLEQIGPALARVGTDKLRLDPHGRSVEFLAPGLSIDLGAIGKGYALDRCAELLARAAVDSYLVHGGSSSVLARGRRESGTSQQGWTVGLQHPLRADRRLLELQLCNRALGTSGAGTHQFYVQGRRHGHILDPRSGYPVDGILSATVVAPTAALADALSTAFYVMGIEASGEYCARHPDIAALMTTANPRAAGEVSLHTFNTASLAWRLVV